MRYFESRTPSIRVHAGGGEVVQWLTVDGEVGWFSSDKPSVLKSLEKCIAAGIGGVIREIPQAEYEDAVKKAKGRPVWRRDREMLSADRPFPFIPPSADQAVAAPAAKDEAEAPVTPVPVQNPPPPIVRRRGRPPKIHPELPPASPTSE